MTAAGHDRDLIVVGGGIIGRSIAWTAAERGLNVEVFDPDPSRAAAHVAAGMLAPVSEATPMEAALTGLGMASIGRWPAFAAALERASGQPINHRQSGTLHVAVDRDGVAELKELLARLTSMGLPVEEATAADCRLREPLLAPTIRGGLVTEHDHVVEPRLVMNALATAAERAGATHTPERVAELVDRGVLLPSGERRSARHVVVAAGAWSGELAGLPVRPVRGETLHLAPLGEDPPLATNIRGMVAGRSVYVAPRGDGRVVVGSTMEERGFDRRMRVGPVRELLTDARTLVPSVDEMELSEIAVGLRPGSPDNGPLIGRLAPGLWAATGHFRGGILLAPVTAAAIVAMVAGEAVDPAVEPFAPARFEVVR